MKIKSSTILLLSLFVLVPCQLACAGIIENFIYSHKSYAEHIDTEGYILSKTKVLEIMAGKSPSEIKLDTYADINKASKQDEEVFLLVKIRNNGSQAAWGELKAMFGNNSAKITINFIHVGSRWNHYIIPLDAVVWPYKEKSIPQISFKWNSLYAK